MRETRRVETVLRSTAASCSAWVVEKIVSPVKRLDVSPPSDGAAAMILASEEGARKYTRDPVWIDGVGWNVDTQYWTNRDLYYPAYVESAARMAYKMAKMAGPGESVYTQYDRDIAAQVSEGRLANDLIKPVNFQLMYISQAAGCCGREATGISDTFSTPLLLPG